MHKVILTDNGIQFTNTKWVNEFTPCTNLAEGSNRELGNICTLYVNKQHTKWARHLKNIEACLNEFYHEMIGMTLYEAHLKREMERGWESYTDPEIINKDFEITDKNI